ncbi:MAG: circularly permuted type 2 ATP-grasp protein [Gammaproteobacteria bacterium]
MTNVRTESVSPELTQLCKGYGATGSHDEMCAADGGIRAHWHYLMQSLNGMGSGELQRRREEAWRLIRENDVTYNIYSDQDSTSRPWKLDLVPLLIESEEWQTIEAGLMQRAELLNLVLIDLYGPRNLIKKGVIPPELVFSHPGFLNPCVNIPMPDSRALTFYAADLVRDSNGQINVLSDRAQSPSGAGYALENRLVISRVLPSLFRDSHTHRLANFFRTSRHALNRLSPREGEEPNIVLLSPGPANESYFEHAYLANYLGYTLVEGTDLRVRNNRVWLTTLEGRRPVDVILRRMDDAYCDPVELRGDSYLGVPGLTNVVRSGNVAISNPLGSGVLENPALLALLPELSKCLLGEELRIPSVPVWWCGNQQQCDHVLANLHSLVIKPVHPDIGFRFIFGSELSKNKLEELRQKIKARPHLFVGQQAMTMSTVPILAKDGLKARHSVLRSFLVADEHDYMVMPGGLTRVASDESKLVVSNQAGGINKDTWVLATEPEKYVSLLSERRQARLAPDKGGEVPGRVADNMFWAGRYTERAEVSSRILRLILQFVENGESEETQIFRQLLATLTNQLIPAPGATNTDDFNTLQAELLNVISGRMNLVSLTQTLVALLRSVRSVRDRLSSDTWRIINIIDDELGSLRGITSKNMIDATDEQDKLITALTAFTGLTLENMTRGRSWSFLDIGRRIERTLQITRLLQMTLVPVSSEEDQILLADSMLTIVDSIMSYRRRYRYGIKIPELLDLIISDESNPRSLAFQLSKLERHIASLPQHNESGSRTELERLTLETATLIRLADVNRLALADEDSGRRETLETFLKVLSMRLSTLSETLTTTYFRTAETPHQLQSLRSRAE